MKYGAVIVAAGMSTRMKQFKQLMKIGDLSFAERVVDRFAEAGVEEIVMVTGFNADRLEEALSCRAVHFIRNENYKDTRMFDSAKLGLEYLNDRCGRVFFCPVDVPLFTGRTVTKEIECMDREPSAKVIVPEFGGRGGHPILISGDAVSALLAYTGERGMKGAYESLPEGSVVRLSVDDEGTVMDADSPDDFHRLVDLHEARERDR